MVVCAGSIAAMSADGYETRAVTSLRTGSKIAVLCGLPFLALAAYFYFTPLWVPKGDTGGVFGCGTAGSPPDAWGRGACQGVNDAAMLRAIISAALGLLIPALGIALFGVDKRQERRKTRHDDDDFDDFDNRASARRGGRDYDRDTDRVHDDHDMDRDHDRDDRERDSAAVSRVRGISEDEAPSRRAGRRSYEDREEFDDRAGRRSSARTDR